MFLGLYLGIDLGTSSVKSMIVSTDGVMKGLAKRDYSINIPRSGHAEQLPETWWQLTAETIRELLEASGIAAEEISGVGLSGQMHGAVLLDECGASLRPAIIWCDQRTGREVQDIQEILGDELGSTTLNPLSTGFQVASLLWVRRNEPELYRRIRWVLSPKDYIRFKLTGEIGTDYTDASATLAFNTADYCWAENLLERIGLSADILPEAHHSHEIAGGITRTAAAQTGLLPETPVVYGGGDQAMQAVGNGIVAPGLMSVTVGTGGQILMPSFEPIYDPQLRMHTFCGAVPGTWNLMGAILSAGMSLNWLREKILHEDAYNRLNELAGKLTAGSDGLFFFPYLVGERTPHMDSRARGSFWGLTLEHTDAHLVRAVMEGVAFALRDCLDIFYQLNLKPDEIVLAGGGGCSPLWSQILADVLNWEVSISTVNEQACLGAALTAAIGTGAYASYEQARAGAIRRKDATVKPIPGNVEIYSRGYETFRQWYGANRHLFV